MSDTEDFVADTFAAFETACAKAPRTDDVTLRLAGYDIDVRYAAPEIAARFAPSLQHLVVPPASRTDGPSDLTIACWEQTATGVMLPPPPWGLDAFIGGGRIRGHSEGAIRVTYDNLARALTLYDRDNARAVFFAAEPSQLPVWLDRAPFRAVLTWWAGDQRLPLLHASCVADDSGAVAISGASGAGKSTTALACLAAGLRIVGDDACLVRFDPEPTVFSIYSRAKLEPDALAKLPSLASMIVAHHNDQALIDPGPLRAEQAPLRAVLLPTITHEAASRVVPIRTIDATKLLVQSLLREGVGVVDGALGAMTKLVASVPCLRLELGRDLDGVVDAVRGVLAER